jgi:ABC-2 type transport system ATP-binding protein
VADSPLSQLRNSSTSNAIVVVAEFEHDLAQPAILSAIQGVDSIESLGKGQYRIKAGPTVDLRAAIFRLAADQNLTLVGLRQQENSLEGIFKELTK